MWEWGVWGGGGGGTRGVVTKGETRQDKCITGVGKVNQRTNEPATTPVGHKPRSYTRWGGVGYVTGVCGGIMLRGCGGGGGGGYQEVQQVSTHTGVPPTRQFHGGVCGKGYGSMGGGGQGQSKGTG